MLAKEEKCVILDFLPTGYPDRRHAEPIAQAIGCDYFSLLELIPKDSLSLMPEDTVYIGKEERDKVKYIRGSITYNELTNASRNVLPEVVENIVRSNELKFIDFFNSSRMITPRMHQIQLLPGIGKKHLVDILEQRSKRKFDNFADLAQRVKLFPDPIKIVVRRVMMELEDHEKYYIFINKKKPAHS